MILFTVAEVLMYTITRLQGKTHSRDGSNMLQSGLTVTLRNRDHILF